jgi:NAD(P)-dependent dehydrogenase (short-subunit alcohol dehydrogenase family)
MDDQTGKIIVITGANSGLGFEASKELARKNATVIMTARNLEKGEAAANEIKDEIPTTNLEVMKLDLSSLKSVQEFVDQFKGKHDKLHVLINNAGIMQPPKMETEDGFELQIGVNHFGHFALTGLLFDLLKATSGSRVINQSSMAAQYGKMNFDDINSNEKYSRNGAYGQSKLANLLFTYELDRKLKEHRLHDILSTAVHPGYTATNLQHSGPTVGGKSIWSRYYTITNKLMAQNVRKGVLPMLYAATASDVGSGDYFGPRGLAQSRGYPKRVKSPKASYNEADAKRLWEISEEMTEIKFSFD